MHAVKKDLNKLFSKYSSLASEVYNLVTIGSSLKLSPDEMHDIQEMKKEVDDWQKMLNKINNELNELSRHPDSSKQIECYLANYNTGADQDDLSQSIYELSGGSLLADAIKKASSSESVSDSFGQSGSGLDDVDMLQRNMQMNLEFLKLQNAMQMESRQFNSVSNALKVRHDSAIAAVRNIR